MVSQLEGDEDAKLRRQYFSNRMKCRTPNKSIWTCDERAEAHVGQRTSGYFLPQKGEPSQTYGGMDLLASAVHELSHVLGFGDLDLDMHGGDLTTRVSLVAAEAFQGGKLACYQHLLNPSKGFEGFIACREFVHYY